MTSATAARSPGVGDLAPEFSADSTAGAVTLTGLRARSPVLLAFFPLAFTSVCTTEMCEFRDDFDRYAKAGIIVLPISVDSVPTLKEFKAKHDLTIDLASDFRRDISRAYGVLNADKFFSERAYFLIDRNGRIAWKHVEEHTGLKRSSEEILAAVASKL
ncbi:MAG TPA: redoxin domain-containing protein [Gemmatimonadaceae bacterium]|nr:redoxin domain-containing protein [Gemmatimonadaceae bacterium]